MNQRQGVVRTMLRDMQRQIDGRWESHLREHTQHDIFHQREHEQTETSIEKQEKATQVALDKASQVVDARFASTNEWRGAFSDRERDFLAKGEYNQAHEGLTGRIDALEDKEIARVAREMERANTLDRLRQADRDRITRLVAIVGVISAAAGFLLSVLAKLLGGP